jgi:hypothetical protein
MTKRIVQIVLTLVIIFLAWMVYRSIMEPVKFKTTREERELKVVERLKDIRSAQLVYKSVNGRYTADFDTLIDFIQAGRLPIVLKIGTTPDTLTEMDALKMGIIRRDTSYVSVKDSLFKRPDFKLEDLHIIPFSKGEKFEMEAGMIDKGGYMVPVMECRAHYETFLKDMDKQLIINHIDRVKKMERFPGMKFGSMFDASTDGNWE